MKASSTEWIVLEGKLRLESCPQKAAFYLEGPPGNVELLVSTVVIKLMDSRHSDGSSPKKQVRIHPALSHLVYSEVLQRLLRTRLWRLRHPVSICTYFSCELYILCLCFHNVTRKASSSQSCTISILILRLLPITLHHKQGYDYHYWFVLCLKIEAGGGHTRGFGNVLHNATFANGLQDWNLKGCRGSVCDCLPNPQVLPFEGKSFAVMSNRTDSWSGIEQVITDRIDLETMYDVVAYVRTCGPCAKVDVRATLNILEADNNERYITMGRFVVHF